MRVLLLSPHPDDIAWSLGATVARLRTAAVELHTATFFGRSRYAPGHASHGHEAASQVRRAEEQAWAASVGVRLSTFELPDASLRGYDDETEMGATPEPSVVDQVARSLATIIAAQRPDIVFAPIAAGGHVDHVAVRSAVLAASLEAEILWFEDLPYAAAHGAPRTEYPVTLDLREQWPLKQAAVRCFPSQLPEAVLPLLEAHGERIWASTSAAAERLARSLSPSRSFPNMPPQPRRSL